MNSSCKLFCENLPAGRQVCGRSAKICEKKTIGNQVEIKCYVVDQKIPK